MRVPVAGGLELAVADHGEGPPLLLVHGFGGAASAWGEAALSGLGGRRVLAVDLIGHGASDDPDGPSRLSLDTVLDDLERVLDAAGVTARPLCLGSFAQCSGVRLQIVGQPVLIASRTPTRSNIFNV
jgi:pimeloyl-ACP methyl ester carboxylesterase